MTPAETVRDYIDGILTGRIVAGRLLRLAVRRHLDDLEHAEERGYYFNEAIATEACEFFPRILRHTIGEWHRKPFHLTPFQTFITWVLMGWRRVSDGLRRFRKAYVTQARKGGKTEWAAGLALLVSAMDNPLEHGSEAYCVATKEDQAKIMFNKAAAMVDESPSLSRLCDVFTNNISIPSYRSLLRPLGSDSKTNAGWNPHLVVLDEVCDWQGHHRGLWGALTTASGARRQPLRLVTCTAGDETSEIWEEEDDYAVAVVESVLTGNIVDDEYFAVIARLDTERGCEACGGDGCDCCDNGKIPADDPFDESVWQKANPNLGHTIKIDYLRGQAREAKHKPAAKHDFLRYHCNLKVTSHLKVIDMAQWARGGRDLDDWDGEPCYGAWDLGWSSDLASLSIVKRFFVGQDDEGNDRYRYEARSWSFIPEGTQTDLTREPWPSFIASGSLVVTSGNTTDIPGAFKAKLLEVTEQYNVAQWAFDPNNSRHLATELLNEHGIECFKFPQTHGMYNESLLVFLKAISDGQFVHGGDRLLEWCARHLICNKNHRNEMMPDKRRSKEKIDPIVAIIMATGGAMNAVDSGYWNPADGVTL